MHTQVFDKLFLRHGAVVLSYVASVLLYFVCVVELSCQHNWSVLSALLYNVRRDMCMVNRIKSSLSLSFSLMNYDLVKRIEIMTNFAIKVHV